MFVLEDVIVSLRIRQKNYLFRWPDDIRVTTDNSVTFCAKVYGTDESYDIYL